MINTYSMAPILYKRIPKRVHYIEKPAYCYLKVVFTYGTSIIILCVNQEKGDEDECGVKP